MTEAVYLLTLIAVVAALVRKPEMISIVLSAHFGAAVFFADVTQGDGFRSALMGADGIVTVIMWALWRLYDVQRAAIVAALGFLKISFGVFCAIGGVSWVTWASANNAIFIAQVLIAGGFLNGFMAWLGRSRDGSGNGRTGLLGYLEKLP
jgi:hypothetical protein